MESNRRLTINFHTEQASNSPYGAIVSYYQKQETEKTLSLLIDAGTAFWMPFAYQASSTKTTTEVRDAAFKSDLLLQWRRQEIRQQYGLSPEGGQLAVYPQALIKQSVLLQISHRPRINEDSYQDVILKYLFANEAGLNSEQKILWSSAAYWGVLAYQELQLLSAEELKIVAATSVQNLWEQRQLIREYFSSLFGSTESRHRSEPVPLSYSNSTTAVLQDEVRPIGQEELNPEELDTEELDSNNELENDEQIDWQAEQERLRNCPEMDELGLRMFGLDQFGDATNL